MNKSESYLSGEPFFLHPETSLEWMDEHLTTEELIEVFDHATMDSETRQDMEDMITARSVPNRARCMDCSDTTDQVCCVCGRPWCDDCEKTANESESSHAKYEEHCLTCRAKRCGCHIGEAD